MGRELASPEPAIQVNELHSDLSSFWLQSLDSYPLSFLDPRSPGPRLCLLAPKLPQFENEVNQLKPEDAGEGQSQHPEPRACFHTTPVLHHPPVQPARCGWRTTRLARLPHAGLAQKPPSTPGCPGWRRRLPGTRAPPPPQKRSAAL